MLVACRKPLDSEGASHAASGERDETNCGSDHPDEFSRGSLLDCSKGSAEHCGEAVREFNPEHIGIRIDRTDLLLPDYLFYALTHVHQSGHWKQLATGTLSLVNIRVSDVRSIELSPR
ncbi:Orf9 [Pseudomonas syringae pv. papulans]|nr:Orf9 [Pseudomonas syringae pv. papulans]